MIMVAKDNNVQLARGSIFNKPWLRTIPASVYDTKVEIFFQDLK